MPEKYVSMKELIEFNKKNYIHNVWNQGMSKLVDMYPTVPGFFGEKENCISMKLQKRTIAENECLEIELRYEGNYSSTFKIGKKNNRLFIFDSRHSISEQENILSNIDFNNLYNLYMENEFFTQEYYLKGYYVPDRERAKIEIEYGSPIEIDITLNEKEVKIGDYHYQIKYAVNLNRTYKSESRSSMGSGEYEYKIKSLYATDPDFLNNLVVEFEKLPRYIQELLYSNPFEEPEKSELNKKGGFQKIKQFFNQNRK